MLRKSVITRLGFVAFALIYGCGAVCADEQSNDNTSKKSAAQKLTEPSSKTDEGNSAASKTAARKTAASKSASTKSNSVKRASAKSAAQTEREIKKGMRLFKSYDCTACHRIGDVGCNDGISLDGIGRKRSEQFLLDHLKNPEEHVAKNQKAFVDTPVNLMPNPDLDYKEIKVIVKYLQSLR